MHELILWSGFFGAWLLVAGPLYQAAQELDEEEVSRDDFEGLKRDQAPEDKPSAWWWLFPPVGYWKQRKYTERQRDAVMAAMPREMMVGLVSYMNKATAWFYVAAGAFLIALKETYELGEGHEWPTVVFWVLVVVMFAMAAVNTAVRMSRTHSLVERS
jgi:hypothetical protein